MNKDIKTWLGCAGYIVIAILLYKSCDWYSEHQKEKYREEKRNDSIRKAYISDSIERRKAFVADSLSRDPHYQDSVLQAEKEFKIWYDSVSAVRDRTIAGVMINGDSVYHKCFHGSFFIEDRIRLLLVSNKEVKTNGLELCVECKETEDILMRYEDGELFDEESAIDHDFIPKEEAGDYCHHYHDNY